MHRAYTKEEWLGDLTIFHWHKAFSEDRYTAALRPHIGRPLSICTEEIVNTVAAVDQEDHHITVRQLAQAPDISKSSLNFLHPNLNCSYVVILWEFQHNLIVNQFLKRNICRIRKQELFCNQWNFEEYFVQFFRKNLRDTVCLIKNAHNKKIHKKIRNERNVIK